MDMAVEGILQKSLGIRTGYVHGIPHPVKTPPLIFCRPVIISTAATAVVVVVVIGVIFVIIG